MGDCRGCSSPKALQSIDLTIDRNGGDFSIVSESSLYHEGESDLNGVEDSDFGSMHVAAVDRLRPEDAVLHPCG